MKEIERMIAETREWRDYHKSRLGNIGGLEALACNIRLKALEDAKKAIEDDLP